MDLLVRKLASSVSYFGVLALLSAIGLWGHHTHWSFSPAAHAADVHDDAEPAEALPDEDLGPKSISYPNPQDVQAAGIVVASVEIRDVEDHLTASAIVAYDESRIAHMAPRAPGHVYQVLRRLGQAVRRGDVIILVDSEEVGTAKAQFLQDAVTANYRAMLLDRIKGITGGAIPERIIRETEAQLQDSLLQRFNAYQRLVNLGLPVDIDALSNLSVQEMAQRIQFLGIPEAIVEQMSPKPATANLIPMIAPFDGIVVQQQTVLGEMVQPEHPPVTIADVSRMWLRLSLRKEDAQRVAVGQPVHFHGDGLAETVDGRITWISPEIDEKTRTVQARAEVVNPPFHLASSQDGSDFGLQAISDEPLAGTAAAPRYLLAVNQFGVAHVRVNLYPEALVVPESAVQRLMDGTTLVFVADPNGLTFHPRPVELGVIDGESVQITNGLSASDKVVVRGAYVLKSELLKSSMVAN